MRFSAQFHRYSLNNQLLIWLAAPAARHVAGFHAWKALGRHVTKGAKAVRILGPLTVPDHAAAPGLDRRPARVLVGFRYVSVFTDHDTEGAPLPSDAFLTVQGGDDRDRALLDRLVCAALVPMQWETHDHIAAHGWTDGGRIVLNTSRCADEPAHAVRVFLHEWAHVALHFQGAGTRAEDCPDRHTRELEADAAAYVLSHVHGIDAAPQVADDITLWGGNPATLRASLTRIVRSVSGILGALEPQPAPAIQAAG